MTGILKARFMEGLVLWLPMTEGAGTVVRDQSKYQNNGVFGAGAAAPSWVTGRDGLPSLDFDGGGDYVALPTNPWSGLATGTIESRIKINTLPVGGADYLYAAAAFAGGKLFYRLLPNGRMTGTIDNLVMGVVTTDTVFTIDTPYDFVITWDGANVNHYINGILDANSPHAFVGGSGPGAGVDWIGKGWDLTTLDAIIGGVKTYSRTLDPYEIRSHSEMVRKI